MSIGYGASQGLETVLARLFQEQLEKQRVAEQERKFGMDERRMAQDQTQFDQGMALNRDRFSADRSDAEFNQNRQSADMAMRGTEFAQGVQDSTAKQSSEDARFQATMAMRGTEMANENEQNRLDRSAQMQAANMRMAGSAPPSTPTQSPYSSERAQRVIQSVDALIQKVGLGTAGLGSMMANVPGTSARDFRAELDTLKANIAFNELTQMREASKTGGALGNVSERELDLLSSALGALDAGQSPQNLKAQLQRVKDSIARWQQAVAGQQAGGAGISIDAAQQGMGAQPTAADLIKKYGGAR